MQIWKYDNLTEISFIFHFPGDLALLARRGINLFSVCFRIFIFKDFYVNYIFFISFFDEVLRVKIVLENLKGSITPISITALLLHGVSMSLNQGFLPLCFYLSQ